MSFPRPPLRCPSLSKPDMVAVILIGLGMLGMIRHLISNSGSGAPPGPEPHVSHETPRKSPLQVPAGIDGGGAAVSDAVSDLRRRLREFIIPDPQVEALSVQEALAKLQEHWRTLPHETDAVPPVEFVLDDVAVRQLETADAPPPVSLPVPNVSLLTNLRLLAAQADLRVDVVKTGVVLSPAPSRIQSDVQPASLALGGRTLEHFADAGASNPGRLFRTHNGVEFTATVLKNGITEWAPSTAGPAEHGLADAAMEVEATVADDGYTIDLNLASEVIEFEGFINYGSPIQTTGVNTLGTNETIILTDSKITQPVFATRELTDRRRQALSRILSSMGLSDRTGIPPAMAEPFLDPQAPDSFVVKRAFNRGLGFLDLGQYDEARKQFEKAQTSAPTNPQFGEQLERAQFNLGKLLELYESHPGDQGGPSWTRQVMSFSKGILTAGEDSPSGYSWDGEAGLLSATDISGRTRRILTEVAAAIQESVRLGASLEFTAATEWLDGRPPKSPAAKSTSPPPATASRAGFSSAPPAAAPPKNTRLTLRCGTRRPVGTTVAVPASRSFSFLPQTGKNLHVCINAAGAGFQVLTHLNIPQAPNFASMNPGSAPAVKIASVEFLVPGPQWSRFDYSAAEGGTGSGMLSLFVKLSRATVPDE